MRKSVGTENVLEPVNPREWLDLEHIASVEVSSEDPAAPIEAALSLKDAAPGWRAGTSGEQKITILFDAPTLIHLVQLQFIEPAEERTQEFVLRWSDHGKTMREVTRQQWNFSPNGSTSEVENLHVNLAGVMAIELTIRPDISHGPAVATLARMRFA